MKNHVKSDRHLALDDLLKTGTIPAADARKLRSAQGPRRDPSDHWPTGDVLFALLVAFGMFCLACAYFDVPLASVAAWFK